MTRNQRMKAMVFLGLGVLVTATLALSLSQLELQPGLPSPLLEGNHIILPEFSQSSRIDQAVFPFILRLAGILLSIYLLVTLFSLILGMGREKLLRLLREFSLMIAAFVILILVLLILQRLPTQPVKLIPTQTQSVPQIFTLPDSPPSTLVWVVGISLALLAAILLFYWLHSRRRSPNKDLLLEQIENARDNILAGMNLDEVISRCYLEMSLVLQQEAGIERKSFTTPTEFERELVIAGLPRTPVHELTQLFESVRYGRVDPTPEDEQEALNHLQKILSHLRRQGAVDHHE